MRNILIVDDEKYVRLGVKTLIKRSDLCDGEVVEAKNGVEAINKLKEMKFDLILSDIKMPIMGGLELISEIKSNSLSNAKIVMISGYDEFEYAVEAMRNGASEYLLKPIERDIFTTLLEKINTEIEQKSLEGIKEITLIDNEEDKVQKIKRAIEYIKENYDQNINMAVVSNEVSMNYTFFSETFKEVSGKSFVEYLKIIRINMAKKLLKSTNVQISKISTQVGFVDEKHFSKSFKLEVGLTPSEYRKQSL